MRAGSAGSYIRGCGALLRIQPLSVASLASLWLAAFSIGVFCCFCVGSGMLISGSTAGPFRRPAIANQSIPPFDRPRVPLYWCQVLQRVVIRPGRRSKCRRLARFHTHGRGRRQCPSILTHRATAMSASVLLSHVVVEFFEAAAAYVHRMAVPTLPLTVGFMAAILTWAPQRCFGKRVVTCSCPDYSLCRPKAGCRPGPPRCHDTCPIRFHPQNVPFLRQSPPRCLES